MLIFVEWWCRHCNGFIHDPAVQGEIMYDLVWVCRIMNSSTMWLGLYGCAKCHIEGVIHHLVFPPLSACDSHRGCQLCFFPLLKPFSRGGKCFSGYDDKGLPGYGPQRKEIVKYCRRPWRGLRESWSSRAVMLSSQATSQPGGWNSIFYFASSFFGVESHAILRNIQPLNRQ